VSDINTAVVDSLKVLDLKRPIREVDNPAALAVARYWTRADIGRHRREMTRSRMTNLGVAGGGDRAAR
jgi:hypothetical protein